MIKVINIKTGKEVHFSTLEGAEKTVKAFPGKYKFPEDVEIVSDEPVIEDVIPEIADDMPEDVEAVIESEPEEE